MVRPRWHDVLIVLSIVGLLGAGVWALWWDDVLGALGKAPPAAQAPTAPTARTVPST